MGRGGARNRSGPAPLAGSAQSDKKGYHATTLPQTGYTGKAPDFPLPGLKKDDGTPDLKISRRERDIWRKLWTTPQAVQWVKEEWRWLIVAEMCRIQATVELNPGKSAALVAQLHRYRDQCGLTPAGLRDNGWKIQATAETPVAIKPVDNVVELSARERFRKAKGGEL